MDNIKVCPHCGGQQFMAYIKRGGIVESVGIDDDGKPQFKVIKEGAKGKYELEIIRCVKCSADITENDLIGGVPCKTCGKLMNPNALDENGNCEVCAMLVTNPQLKNASQDDLLRMLARAMKSAKGDTSLVEQKQVQAAQAPPVQNDIFYEPPGGGVGLETTEVQQEDGTPSAADAILQGGTVSEEPTTRPRRRRSVKRGGSDTATATTEETLTENATELAQQQEAVENLGDAQNAPFPEVEGMPPVQQEQQQAPAELPPVGSGFQMFDNGDDDEPF